MRCLAVAALVALAGPVAAQGKVTFSGGDVSRASRVDERRLSSRIPVPGAAQRERVRVGGDSAQRVAMHDFGWRGRVLSVELDEDDERVYWDVKIVPDTAQRTVIRYRVDAASSGILGIREFTDLAGLVPREARKP
jgi:hypothetical protein